MRPWLVLASIVAVAACDGSSPTPLGGARDAASRDGGASADDAAPGAELGPAARDAASADDAAMTTPDASASADAAPTTPDATPADDAAAAPDDAAAPNPSDAAAPDDATAPDDGATAPGDGGMGPGDGGTAMPTYVESPLVMPLWIDACASGATAILTDDDDGHTDPPTTLPFPFLFWGAPVTTVSASTNGYLVFDATPTDGYEPIIPDVTEGAAVYALWEDLFINGPATSICVATVGASPSRSFVVEWRNMASLGADADTTLTFQVVLHEGTHAVDIVFGTLSATDPLDATFVDGTSAVIGLQSAQGASVVQHAGAVAPMTGLSFTP